MKVGLARDQPQYSIVRIGRPSSVVANGEEGGMQTTGESCWEVPESFFHRNNHVI